ncbi:MAG: PHB depolymerase family esterase [SAR86 cluster bacterium]|nr:PHB depolymerase family esterase [SAR86 cluster bacterium]
MIKSFLISYKGLSITFLFGLCLGFLFTISYLNSLTGKVFRDPPSQGSFESFKTTHDGLERSFDVYIPSTLSINPPAIFVFHGSFGKSEDMRWITGYDFEYLAEEKGFLVVYPQGYKNFWNDCRASADYLANLENIDDLGFFKKVVKLIVKDFKVDPTKIITTGLSNGGHMVYKLALEAPEDVFIAAPLAANLPVEENSDCTPSGLAVHMMIFNGTNDPINPFDGGVVKLQGNASRGAVLSSDDTYKYWVNLIGPAREDTFLYEEKDGDIKTSVTRKQSNGKRVVALYSLVNSGHVVATPNTNLGYYYGGTAGDIITANEIFSLYEELSSQ